MVDRDIRGMNTSGLSHADLSLVEAGINSAVVGLGLSVLEVRFSSGTLRVTLDADPTPDLEIITEASKLISELLDLDLAERVAELRQNYELEVSSPGLERPLFNAEHFRRFAGRLVEIKTRSTNGSKTRVQGVIRSSDGSGVELEIEGTPERRRFDFDTIESAKTVFVWPQEKKPKNSRSKGTSRGSAKGNAAKAAEFKSSSGQVEEIDQDLEDELDDDLLSAEDQAMIGVEESIEDST
ncbi:MAG: ribosome maturation factor RimP, partial [Acidimicrobiaceae bacterium]|nr:ribosome maturation factor RimP [Acidimicrobiaceae bacterium]